MFYQRFTIVRLLVNPRLPTVSLVNTPTNTLPDTIAIVLSLSDIANLARNARKAIAAQGRDVVPSAVVVLDGKPYLNTLEGRDVVLLSSSSLVIRGQRFPAVVNVREPRKPRKASTVNRFGQTLSTGDRVRYVSGSRSGEAVIRSFDKRSAYARAYGVQVYFEGTQSGVCADDCSPITQHASDPTI